MHQHCSKRFPLMKTSPCKGKAAALQSILSPGPLQFTRLNVEQPLSRGQLKLEWQQMHQHCSKRFPLMKTSPCEGKAAALQSILSPGPLQFTRLNVEQPLSRGRSVRKTEHY
ncbi:hypothetical protein CEXT_216411 [Caerostris extrusa]|uniref:Uncharacterized protein n=1 Tax=Caerostris extrusa TaxID=172846 RepID=A0AAV4Y3E5_CAEEX|nr:hypothetical protein CEXT_216411 [Caerostris extrusa]